MVFLILVIVQAVEFLIFSTGLRQVLYDQKNLAEGSKLGYSLMLTQSYYSVQIHRVWQEGKFRITLYDQENNEIFSAEGTVTRPRRGGPSDIFEVVFWIENDGNYTIEIQLLDAWPADTCTVEIKVVEFHTPFGVLFLGHDQTIASFSIGWFLLMSILYFALSRGGLEVKLRELSDDVRDLRQVAFRCLELQKSFDIVHILAAGAPLLIFLVALIMLSTTKTYNVDLLMLLKNKVIIYAPDLAASILMFPIVLIDKDYICVAETGEHYIIGIKKNAYFIRKRDDVKLVITEEDDEISLSINVGEEEILILSEKAGKSKIRFLKQERSK